ncbi:MAG: response regulator [Bdellovibrionales bacterium]|nr:response regulator [Bdellovibrionales bacterium]
MSFRILVIDDDEDILALMTRILGREGFVETAENGRVALERIGISRPDFIVCDVRMPVCDGFEFDKGLTDLGLPSIPILFISGFAGPNHADLEKSLNYVGFMEKPVPRAEIVHFIRAYEAAHSSRSSP